MRKQGFLTNAKKNAGKNAAKYLLTTGGAIGSSMATSTDKFMGGGKKKWKAFGAWGVGLVSNLVNPEEYSNALLTGVGADGAVKAIAAVSKKPAMYGVDPNAVGLVLQADGSFAGVDDDPDADADDNVGAVDWARLAREAQAGSGTEGIYDTEDPEEEMELSSDPESVVDSLI